MNESTPLITSRFTITGDSLNPDHCTKMLNIKPTEVGLKGEKRPKGRPDVPVTFWSVSIANKRYYSIEESISEMLDLLWPHRAELVSLLSTSCLSASLESTVKIYGDRPEYCLEPETLQRIAFLKASYCLGIYDYSDQERLRGQGD